MNNSCQYWTEKQKYCYTDGFKIHASELADIYIYIYIYIYTSLQSAIFDLWAIIFQEGKICLHTFTSTLRKIKKLKKLQNCLFSSKLEQFIRRAIRITAMIINQNKSSIINPHHNFIVDYHSFSLIVHRSHVLVQNAFLN